MCISALALETLGYNMFQNTPNWAEVGIFKVEITNKLPTTGNLLWESLTM